MKIKRKLSVFTFYLSIISLSLLLSGCQLALAEDKIAQGGRDELCGVLVTFGDQSIPIDKNEIKDIKVKKENGVLTLDDSSMSALFSQKVEGRRSDDNYTLTFDGIQGYYLGKIQYTNVNSELESLMTSGEYFNDVKYNVNTSDHESTSSSEATILVSKNFHDMVKVNPVFLRDDGSYYTDLGGGHGSSAIGLVTGTVFTLTLDESNVKTAGDTSSAEKNSFTVRVKVVDAVDLITIKEMNQMDELIKETSYHRDDPSEFVVDPNTSYVIVEELFSDESKACPVKRSIYTIDDNSDSPVNHICHYESENGVILNQTIQFVRSSTIKK